MMDKKGLLSSLAVTGILVLSFMSFLVPTVHAVTTVTGWLIPDPVHWNNGFGAILYPLMGVGLTAGMGKLVDVEGDFAVTLILAGLVVGGLLSMLSVGASGTNVIPFALVVVPAVDLMIWMWRGGG